MVAVVDADLKVLVVRALNLQQLWRRRNLISQGWIVNSLDCLMSVLREFIVYILCMSIHPILIHALNLNKYMLHYFVHMMCVIHNTYNNRLDDLDPRALQKKRASLEINDDIIHQTLTIQHQQPSNSKREISGMSGITEPTSHQSNYTSASHERQISQQSKQSGVVSAIVRRFAGSRFSSLQSDYHTQESIQEEEENPRRAPMVGVPNSNNRGRDDDNRRATIMTRNNRRSIGTRSSISRTSSASTVPNDERRDTYCLSDSKIHTLRYIINHPIWKSMTLFFILILLFGPPINDIWLPKEADLYVDIMLSIAFVVLAIDIMIRCVVDKSYFAWDRNGNYWGRRDKCCHRRSSCVNVHCGSFMFWFDTVCFCFACDNFAYLAECLCCLFPFLCL